MTEQEWIALSVVYENKSQEDGIDEVWRDYLEIKAQACREAACYAREEQDGGY
jgi:hypothetical protein